MRFTKAWSVSNFSLRKVTLLLISANSISKWSWREGQTMEDFDDSPWWCWIEPKRNWYPLTTGTCYTKGKMWRYNYYVLSMRKQSMHMSCSILSRIVHDKLSQSNCTRQTVHDAYKLKDLNRVNKFKHISTKAKKKNNTARSDVNQNTPLKKKSN